MKKKNCKEQTRSVFNGKNKKGVKEKKPTSSQTRHRFKSTIKHLYPPAKARLPATPVWQESGSIICLSCEYLFANSKLGGITCPSCGEEAGVALGDMEGDNFIINVVLSKKKVKSDPMPITRVYKRSNKRYRKKKLTYSEKKERERKKYFNKIKKLKFKYGKRISIGIEDCLYKCQINEITEKYISVVYKNGYINKYSLKNLLIMMKHADYLKNIEKERAEIRLKMRYRVFQF